MPCRFRAKQRIRAVALTAGSTAAGVLADGEAGQWTTENFSQMGHWFRQLMADSFA